MGRITTTDTVMRMEVGVCMVAREAVLMTAPFFIMAARELAWLIYW